MHPEPRKIFPVFLLVVIAGAAWWYFSREGAAVARGALKASGTIEATQILLASELGGEVRSVHVQTGDEVKAGQPLVRFEDVLLQAQLEQAQANLVLAQANYALIAAGPPEEERRLLIAKAKLELLNAEQVLETLYEKAPLQAAQLLHTAAVADKAWDTATQRLANMRTAADQSDVDTAWAAVVIARDRLEQAKEDFEPYEKKSADNVVRALFQSKVADAQRHYDSAVTRYNNIVGTANQYELALAEAEVTLAQAQRDDANRHYQELKDGPDPDEVASAEARLAAAQAGLAAAQANPSEEQLAVAQAQVQVAQEALDVLRAQLDKAVVTSPIDGIVLTRSVEPGEVVLPGAPLLTLARLDDLTITVFVPEDRYGVIRLGQFAEVEVDSFPGERFQAEVIRIADQAEFTPRNVQTEEGRRTTVFAVELVVVDTQNKLKPGMPADVVFQP